MGKQWKQWQTILGDFKTTADGDCSHEIKRCLLLGRKLWQTRQCIKKQRHYFTDERPYSQSYGFFSSHVWMWDLDHKEGLAPQNWCFWTVVLEKTPESPLDSKNNQVNHKGNESWIVIGKTDAEEAPTPWPPHVKSWLIRKDPVAGKDWRQQEKWTTEDEMVGWHYWLLWHEFEQALGDGDGQGSMACCSAWGCKESDMTELNWLNWWHLGADRPGHLRMTLAGSQTACVWPQYFVFFIFKSGLVLNI